MSGISAIAERLHDAWRTGDVPLVPSVLVPGLGEVDAYAIQKSYVDLRRREDHIAGYKVGATVEPVRRSLGLAAPLTGVLLASGANESGAVMRLEDFKRLLIETEIAFRAGEPISSPVPDEATLRRIFAECCPAFELADTGFYGAAETAGTDLIAANAASAAFVKGAWADATRVSPDAMTVTLKRDGEPVYQAPAAGTLNGSQWRSLRWLVDTMVNHGYHIRPGDIFLTGALGPPQPGVPGRYRADYGPLGTVEFTLAGSE
jgi:2-keto-4-pentenoate hydratase